MERATKYYLVKESDYKRGRPLPPPTSNAQYRKQAIRQSFGRLVDSFQNPSESDIYETAAGFREKARPPSSRLIPRAPRRRRPDLIDLHARPLRQPQVPQAQERDATLIDITPPTSPVGSRRTQRLEFQTPDRGVLGEEPYFLDTESEDDRRQTRNVYNRLYDDRLRHTPSPRERVDKKKKKRSGLTKETARLVVDTLKRRTPRRITKTQYGQRGQWNRL